MKFKITQTIAPSKFNEQNDIEKDFTTKLQELGFTVDVNRKYFKRIIVNYKDRGKGAIVDELNKSLIHGKYEIEDNRITLTIDYSKQLVVSFIIGCMVAIILRLSIDFHLLTMIGIGLVSFILLFSIGLANAVGSIKDKLKHYDT